MKIGIGSDHAGYELKDILTQYMQEKGIEVVDFGGTAPDPIDYPIPGEAVANAVAAGEVDRGVLICGTGFGISLAANKVPGIRCCVCSEPYTAMLSRQHNNSNMLSMGARVVGSELAKMILDTWLDGQFEGGRHERRIDMVMAIEKKHFK